MITLSATNILNIAIIIKLLLYVPSGHLDLEGLFLVNGNAERVDWLRQRYDRGEEVQLEKEADLASAVSLLRLFLQELPEPVIPTEIQGHILQLHQGVCDSFIFLSIHLPSIHSLHSFMCGCLFEFIFLFCWKMCSCIEWSIEM